MTRFEFSIMPGDGGPHISMYADHDLALSPSRDDTVIIYHSVTTTVLQVSFAPTMDPAVYVRCRSLFPATTAEAKEIAQDAEAIEGWKSWDR